MAEEKFIRGKKDDGAHDGRASNIRREEESLYSLENWWLEDLDDSILEWTMEHDIHIPLQNIQSLGQ